MSWGDSRTVGSVRSGFLRATNSRKQSSKLPKTIRSNDQESPLHIKPSEACSRNDFEWRMPSEGNSSPINLKSRNTNTSGDRRIVVVPKQLLDLCDTMMPVMSISLHNHKEKNDSLDKYFSPVDLVGIKCQRVSKNGIYHSPPALSGGVSSESLENNSALISSSSSASLYMSSISPSSKFKSLCRDPGHLEASAGASSCPSSTTTSSGSTHNFPPSSLSPRENGTLSLNDRPVFETVFSSPFIARPKLRGLSEASEQGRGRGRGNILQFLGENKSLVHEVLTDVENSRELGKNGHGVTAGRRPSANVPQQQGSRGAEGGHGVRTGRHPSTNVTQQPSGAEGGHGVRTGRHPSANVTQQPSGAEGGHDVTTGRRPSAIVLQKSGAEYYNTISIESQFLDSHSMSSNCSQFQPNSVCVGPMNSVGRGQLQGCYEHTSRPFPSIDRRHMLPLSQTEHVAPVNGSTVSQLALMTNTEELMPLTVTSQPTETLSNLHAATISNTCSEAVTINQSTSLSSAVIPSLSEEFTSHQQTVTSTSQSTAIISQSPPVTTLCPIFSSSSQPTVAIISNSSPEPSVPVVVTGTQPASVSSQSPQQEVGHFPLTQPTTPRSYNMPALDTSDDSSSPLAPPQLVNTVLPSAKGADQACSVALSSGDEKDLCIGRRSIDEVEKRIAALQRSIHCLEVKLKKILSKNEAMAREFESEIQDVVKDTKGLIPYVSTQRVKEFDNLLRLNARAVVAANAIKRGEITRQEFKTKAHAKLGTNKLAKIELDLVLEEDGLKQQIQAAKMQGSVLEQKLDFYINDNYS